MENKNYKDVAQVGDIIKSYDFTGVDSCYVIGKVLEKQDSCDLGNFGAFKVELIKMVREHKDVTSKQEEIDSIFYIPFEYNFDREEWTRVQKI